MKRVLFAVICILVSQSYLEADGTFEDLVGQKILDYFNHAGSIREDCACWIETDWFVENTNIERVQFATTATIFARYSADEKRDQWVYFAISRGDASDGTETWDQQLKVVGEFVKRRKGSLSEYDQASENEFLLRAPMYDPLLIPLSPYSDLHNGRASATNLLTMYMELFEFVEGSVEKKSGDLTGVFRRKFSSAGGGAAIAKVVFAKAWDFLPRNLEISYEFDSKAIAKFFLSTKD